MLKKKLKLPWPTADYRGKEPTMSVTIHTTKEATTAAASVELETEEGIEEVLHSTATDFLGDLEEQIATAQEKVKKSKHFVELKRLQDLHEEAIAAVREELGYVKGAVANDDKSITGLRFRAILSKSANSTMVSDKAGLVKWIEASFSKAELMELMKFGIGELKSYLPKKAFDEFTTTKRVGTRKLVLKAFKPLNE